MATKQPVSIRLSERTIRELKRLADSWRISQADVIAVLVHAAEYDKFDELDEMVDLIKMV
jgi:cytosine/adenosine deaminase-related metal-dependent hydrolase